MYSPERTMQDEARSESGGEEVNRMLGVALDRLETLKNRLDNRLGGVLLPALPQTNEKLAGVSRSVAPMFEDMRSKLGAINRVINEMEDTVSRVDL